jgi:hypothetical protein
MKPGKIMPEDHGDKARGRFRARMTAGRPPDFLIGASKICARIPSLAILASAVPLQPIARDDP